MISLVVPVPVILPGLIVQFPEGNPFSTTLPVAWVQVGCVMMPMIGAAGVTGWVLITISLDNEDVQPKSLVTE